jgi:hypothetical protein
MNALKHSRAYLLCSMVVVLQPLRGRWHSRIARKPPNATGHTILTSTLAPGKLTDRASSIPLPALRPGLNTTEFPSCARFRTAAPACSSSRSTGRQVTSNAWVCVSTTPNPTDGALIGPPVRWRHDHPQHRRIQKRTWRFFERPRVFPSQLDLRLKDVFLLDSDGMNSTRFQR